MTEIKSEDFQHNDRVELSEYFDVHAHGSGFQLRSNENYYSIIPIKKARKKGLGQKIAWEVNSDKHRFDELHEAIEYVLDEENVSVSVESIKEYYGMDEADKE